VENLRDNSGACGGAGVFENVFKMLLDRLFCQLHFAGDLLIGPAFQEMLPHSCFACSQVKSLLRLSDGLILGLQCANLHFAYHDEDSFFCLGSINQGRPAKNYGAMDSVHEAPELNLLPILRIGMSMKDFLNLVGEASINPAAGARTRFSDGSTRWFVRMTSSWIEPQLTHRAP
jgi:hypothetical protein